MADHAERNRALGDALRTTFESMDEPAPEHVWPTAPHVWFECEVWTRDGLGDYGVRGGSHDRSHLSCTHVRLRDEAVRFAREAIPVTLVPTEAWEEWERLSLTDHHDTALVDAVDHLAQEVAR